MVKQGLSAVVDDRSESVLIILTATKLRALRAITIGRERDCPAWIWRDFIREGLLHEKTRTITASGRAALDRGSVGPFETLFAE